MTTGLSQWTCGGMVSQISLARATTDSKLWADDVNAVIEALSLDHPILCGWSYGPLVILDYIRHYGEDEHRRSPLCRWDHEARQ